jgi:predicted O-methyltransferase YrrM
MAGVGEGMIERILAIKAKTDFDFRSFACLSDELACLFDDLVDDYRLKYAIAAAIEPQAILEIGVRYGYSAVAFLSAAPQARYLGLEADTSRFAEALGAIDWAREITRGHAAEFLRLETRSLAALPGGTYDLIHIDSQQDGDGTVHDLELAIRQGATC